MKLLSLFSAALLILGCSGGQTADTQRKFIAHRGVNMRYVAAGENSLEAIRLASRAGFTSIETDVRMTSDSVLVCLHDNTLRRTCLNKDGSRVAKELAISDISLAELKADYVLRAEKPEMRTQIPTLEEYLKVCKEEGLEVFIEPKLKDPSGRHYLDIVACADSIFGRGNYIVTSNNFANSVIRDTLKIQDIPLMGILYQTTYQDIVGKGNIIVAVSASRFSSDDYAANVSRAKQDGYRTESHADDFAKFDMINNADIDYVSTDFLAPDWNGQGETVLFKQGKGEKALSQVLALSSSSLEVDFGAVYLEMEFSGSAEIGLAGQNFPISSASGRTVRHQVLLSDMKPALSVAGLSPDFALKRVSYRVVRF